MSAGFRSLVLICAIVGAVALQGQRPIGEPGARARVDSKCGIPPWVALPGRGATSPQWSCVPPYETPTYTLPSDDSVVFGSLLEAAGYSGAANSDWVGVAAGNFCGKSERQLLLIATRTSPLPIPISTFSILGGPTPHLVQVVNAGHLSFGHRWRAIAAGKFGKALEWPAEGIVAIRATNGWPIGEPNLVVAKFNRNCTALTEVASASIGNPFIDNLLTSDWVGVAVGNFTAIGPKQIALLKTDRSNFFLVELTRPNNKLSVIFRGDLDSDSSQPWKALVAGDIDGDGVDELIAVREVSDGRSPTVLVYKWTGSGFRLFATSTFGNNGNSNWAGAAVGDFNGDGRQAIVLVKNKHSNFVVLDLPRGATQLRTLSTDDLDSVEGLDWRGLAAADWLGGDQGASELIAVRAVDGQQYRTNIFVYGNPFHRISRDTGRQGTKAQYNAVEINVTTVDLKNWLRDTHTNTLNWSLQGPGDYPALVQFLGATRDWGVDGKQLRVWVTLQPPSGGCSLPEESKTTVWSAASFFPKGLGVVSCREYLGWASLIGRLARDFPHLVALGIDDFTHCRNRDHPYTQDYIAEMESRMRSEAPWLNFVPTAYYEILRCQWADIALTFDSMLFYFRNEKEGKGPCSRPNCPLVSGQPPADGGCLDNTCAEPTVNNAPGEFNEMVRLLPKGRKLQVGVYFSEHSSLGEPSARYDFELTRLYSTLPTVGGVTAYFLQTPHVTCTDTNFLSDKYCTLKRAYGFEPHEVAPSRSP